MSPFSGVAVTAVRPRRVERTRKTAWERRALGLGEGLVRDRVARRASPFHPVVVKTDASLEDVAALEARRMELP